MEDTENLQNYFHQGGEETTHTLLYGQTQPISKLIDKIDLSQKSASEVCLGAFEDRRIIGYVHFRLISPTHPCIKHIGEFGIITLKEFWGHGIGSNLIKITEKHARDVGAKRIEAKVRTSNERGLNFYKKHGYQIEGIRKNAALINDQYEDEYYIAKIFC